MTSIITNTDLKEEHQYIAIQLIHIITKYDASWIKTNDDIVSSNRGRKLFQVMSLLFGAGQYKGEVLFEITLYQSDCGDITLRKCTLTTSIAK